MLGSGSGNVFSQEVDRGPRLLYDRLTTAAGGATASLYPFFTVLLSSTKTLSDTNLGPPGVLQPPEMFMVQAIGFCFGPTMLYADVAGFLKNYYHQWKIGNGKVYSEGPLFLFPGGTGITGYATTNHTTTALIQVTNNGAADLNTVRRFADWPRNIPASVAFRVEVSAGAGTVTLAASVASTIVSPAYGGLDLMTYLDGIKDVAVQ